MNLQPHDLRTSLRLQQRRTFLAQAGRNVGAVALAALFNPSPRAAAAPAPSPARGLPGLPNLPPRVKRVIWLCMAGGPSHLELFDHKPKLAQLSGQPMPDSFTAGMP